LKEVQINVQTVNLKDVHKLMCRRFTWKKFKI